jgi:hypothetical protein
MAVRARLHEDFDDSLGTGFWGPFSQVTSQERPVEECSADD